MERRNAMLRAVGIAAAGVLAAATGARAEPSAAMDASPPPPLAPQMQHGVEFVTGGVGDAEQTELFAEPARDYNVRITLTDPGGAYLSDVHVRIADADGNTKLDTRTNGPLLLVELDAGRYTVEATRSDGGATERRTLDVPADGAMPVRLYVALAMRSDAEHGRS